ncbi:MAG: hypothetical protein RIG84_00350 [Roseovarius sp.]
MKRTASLLVAGLLALALPAQAQSIDMSSLTPVLTFPNPASPTVETVSQGKISVNR